MPSKRRKSGVVALPSGVHRVVSRGREYYYWHPARGTQSAGPRMRLPSDPTSPEFWTALRDAQGGVERITTFRDVADLYETSAHFLGLGNGTRAQYRRALRVASEVLGTAPADGLRPVHVRELMDGLSDIPGTANMVLGTLRALSSWALARDHFPASITEGVKPYAQTGGHKPWTLEQQDAAAEHLTGMVRRGYFLLRYTGQRGSDAVRLGETFIDEGGFRLNQGKTGREIWCPIDDALASEMATWERSPGPYLRQDSGKPYTRKLLDNHFADQRKDIPALTGATLHGLRATRVIELRGFGLTTTQIQDQVGMSLGMIERYCRFADKKASGKASVVALSERRKNAGL